MIAGAEFCVFSAILLIALLGFITFRWVWELIQSDEQSRGHYDNDKEDADGTLDEDED